MKDTEAQDGSAIGVHLEHTHTRARRRRQAITTDTLTHIRTCTRESTSRLSGSVTAVSFHSIFHLLNLRRCDRCFRTSGTNPNSGHTRNTRLCHHATLILTSRQASHHTLYGSEGGSHGWRHGDTEERTEEISSTFNSLSGQVSPLAMRHVAGHLIMT